MTGSAILSTARDWPKPVDPDRVATGFEAWHERVARIEDPALAGFARDLAAEPTGRPLLEALFAHSPYLTRCALAEIEFLRTALNTDPDVVLGQLLDGLKSQLARPRAGSGAGPGGRAEDRSALMRDLRIARRRTALLVALADISGIWCLEQVTQGLTHFAEVALDLGVAHLLADALRRGELEALPEGSDARGPLRGCGFALLAMGKMGAHELNYSSDIDLIALYDPEAVDYRGRRSVQDMFVRFTRDLVTILSTPTAEGLVFRTDLRLRPDPGATPIAISVNAALSYYESMGQNWERAAMVKARAAAGDLALGTYFLAELRPFVWRKHLDFWAIRDIHSIKRQINTHKIGFGDPLLGRNVKLGRGGIREIEFFVQTQQLIFGGRDPRLRDPDTLGALKSLARAARISETDARDLAEAYRFLRSVEHRLQMVEDQQTHSLPGDEAGLARIGAFLGFADGSAFAARLSTTLDRVERAYGALFEEEPSLSAPGNLVFTGGEAEPGTLETLAQLGFKDGPAVFEAIRSWHHGRYRATRSTRSRELLTELVPSLLEALGKTSDPDAGLVRFGEFLAKLPAGIQIFSMLHANPILLELLAEIMGRAPALAERLGRNPALLEAVLSEDFFESGISLPELRAELGRVLGDARDFQDVLDLSRRWAADRRFRVGVQLLRHAIDGRTAAAALSDIAESAVAALHGPVLDQLAQRHGRVAGADLAVLALGKLGSREMTVTSDLDLIFVYGSGDTEGVSDGVKPLDATTYFARFAQRLINALSAATAEGKLYDIDMRLRPSGNKGPIAVSLKGFRRYQLEDAWTWEHLALTRARVIVAEPALRRAIEAVIGEVLALRRDPGALAADVAEMRGKIARERPGRGAWDVKDRRGGLVDLEFVAQFLQLRHGHEHPGLLHPTPEQALLSAGSQGLIEAPRAERLAAAARRLSAVQGFLRLTVGDRFDAESAPAGLKAALAGAAGAESFEALAAALEEDFRLVRESFATLVEAPAEAAAAARAG